MNVEIEDITPDEFMKLSKDELSKVPFERKKWMCICKGCDNKVNIKDYSIAPFYYWRRHWVNTQTHFYLCSKHYKFVKHLEKSFEKWRVAQRLFDYNKIPIQ